MHCASPAEPRHWLVRPGRPDADLRLRIFRGRRGARAARIRQVRSRAGRCSRCAFASPRLDSHLPTRPTVASACAPLSTRPACLAICLRNRDGTPARSAPTRTSSSSGPGARSRVQSADGASPSVACAFARRRRCRGVGAGLARCCNLTPAACPRPAPLARSLHATGSSSNVTRRSRAAPASGAGAHPFAPMVRAACPCGTVCVPASGGDGSHARGCGGRCLPLSAFAGSLSAGQGTRCVSLSVVYHRAAFSHVWHAGRACGLNRSFPRPGSAAAVAALAHHVTPFFLPDGRWLITFVLALFAPCAWCGPGPRRRAVSRDALGSSWRTLNSSIGRFLR